MPVDDPSDIILISSDEEDLKDDYNDEAEHVCEETSVASLSRCSPPVLLAANRPRRARWYPGSPLEDCVKSEEMDDSSSTTMDEDMQDAAESVDDADMELIIEKIEDDEGSFERENLSCRESIEEEAYVTCCEQSVSSPNATPQCPTMCVSERITELCPLHCDGAGTVDISFNSPSAVEKDPLLSSSNEPLIIMGENTVDDGLATSPQNLSHPHANDILPWRSQEQSAQGDEVDQDTLRGQAEPPKRLGDSSSSTMSSSPSILQLPQGPTSDARAAQGLSLSFAPVLAPLLQFCGHSYNRQDHPLPTHTSPRRPTPQSPVFRDLSSLSSGSPSSVSSGSSSTAGQYQYPLSPVTLTHRDQSLPSMTPDAAAQEASSKDGTAVQAAMGGGTTVVASAAVPIPVADPAYDPVVRFLHEVGLSSNLADVLRQVGISDNPRMAALGAMRVAALNQLDKTLQQAGLDFVSRVLIREGLKSRASQAKGSR
ncbi:hypothetical protein C8Q80DRAFT_1126343 [Daedaleopsis nitida]|nr:hypothetical protein C8Q80DRAFT_1126343 [Daedaleopsis nitida]